MDRPVNPDAPLPALREDLRLIEGTGADSGQRGWKIHDPMAQRYFEVDQTVVDLLAIWKGATAAQLQAHLRARSSATDPQQTVAELLQFLEHNELLAARPQATYARVNNYAQATQTSLWSRVLHGYLFFRVPLARPDRFLRRTLPLVAWAFHPAFWAVIGVLGLLGLFLLSRQWEAFLSTFPNMFNAAGLATYGAALVVVKALHELGHGYTAVRLGSRVSTMGVALIVMMPVLYTDTTDAWRLRSRADRVRIDVAGMAVEIMVAVLATLAWVVMPDGALRTAAFALATTGWIMSLAVNCNPFMRFDGYYLMSDLVGVPNLQERSFAMARWWTRELLFGFGDAAPEATSRARRRWFIAYAWATWVYRFFLFLGIALLVYHFFFKALGIFLFAVEIWWFILRPVWREAKVWYERRAEAGRRARLTHMVLAALAVALLVPWPYTLRIPGVLTAEQQAPVYAPRPARIEKILVKPGQVVKAGELIAQLSDPSLEDGLTRSQESERGIEERMARRVADARDRSESLVLERELGLERDRAAGLTRERERLTVRAPIDGTVIDVALELHPGRWIDDKTRLALIAHPQSLQVRGYLDGQELARIDEGHQGRFLDETRMLPVLDVRVSRIAAAASEKLDSALISSIAGGMVPVRQDHGALRPEYAAFQVVAEVPQAPVRAPLTEVRGELQIKGDAQSMAWRAVRRIVQVFVRETVL